MPGMLCVHVRAESKFSARQCARVDCQHIHARQIRSPPMCGCVCVHITHVSVARNLTSGFWCGMQPQNEWKFHQSKSKSDIHTLYVYMCESEKSECSQRTYENTATMCDSYLCECVCYSERKKCFFSFSNEYVYISRWAFISAIWC